MNSSPAIVTRNVCRGDRLRAITVQVLQPQALALPDTPDTAVGIYFDDGVGRSYSVRRVHAADAALFIDVEVFLHGDGPGTAWARAARPGDRVELSHPNGWYAAGGKDWQLLAADMSGLPALCRIIDELPEAATTILALEVLEEADLELLPAVAGLTRYALVGSGNGRGPSRLADLIAQVRLPDGPGYCWCAGEAGQTRLVRKYFRALGWTPERYDITGYWRRDAAGWEARFAPRAEEMMSLYRSARAAGKSDKVALEEFDEALERAGL